MSALEKWTENDVSKFMPKLIEFGRLGVVTKKNKKLKNKMDERGFKVVMIGYALNHGLGVYCLYNPKMNRIIMSRDVKWSTFYFKKLEDGMELFEPGIGTDFPLYEIASGEKQDDENVFSDGEESSISDEDSDPNPNPNPNPNPVSS